MFKRIFSCFVVALSFIHSASCRDVRNAEELVELFSTQTGSPLKETIELQDDLDFSNASLALPLGAKSSWNCVTVITREVVDRYDVIE